MYCSFTEGSKQDFVMGGKGREAKCLDLFQSNDRDTFTLQIAGAGSGFKALQLVVTTYLLVT